MKPNKNHVFLAATICYSLFYVCRLSLSLVKTPLISAQILTAPELGYIGSLLFYSYGIGKLVNGFLADRLSLRRMATVGLLGTALINLLLGFSTGFWVFAGLWLINGWLQSMGAPAFVVSLTRWIEKSRRGTFYGLWSVSHNLGEALTFVTTAAIVTHYGWRAGFCGSAIVGGIGVVILLIFFHDRPATMPSLDTPAPAAETPAKPATPWHAQKAMLANPVVWLVALSSALMYVTRYAINSWGLFFLEQAKGYTTLQASFVISASAIAGIFGTMASGWLSDRWFAGNHFFPALLMGALNAVALAIFVFVPGGYLALDLLAMVLFGISVGALICYLGGLIVVEVAPAGSAGAALGVVGIASYLGAGTQDIISGLLIGGARAGAKAAPVYHFDSVRLFWLGAIAVSTLVIFFSWQLHRRRTARA
ncbi:MAG: MFS transporter [Opitutae bacterium]|nr:MFS transporter [Opitutae bacterium]